MEQSCLLHKSCLAISMVLHIDVFVVVIGSWYNNGHGIIIVGKWKKKKKTKEKFLMFIQPLVSFSVKAQQNVFRYSLKVVTMHQVNEQLFSEGMDLMM